MNYQVSFILYIISMLAFIGMFLFVLFGGIGLSALPIDLINAFRKRPKWLNFEQYIYFITQYFIIIIIMFLFIDIQELKLKLVIEQANYWKLEKNYKKDLQEQEVDQNQEKIEEHTINFERYSFYYNSF